MNKTNISIMMLRTLVSLRETGSISRTAEQLSVSQSAISHTIRALEDTLDTSVLIRKPRGVILTAVGSRACDSAKSALSSIDEIQCLAKSALSGTIRLATVVSASRAIVPDVLTLSRQNHPGLEVSLLIGTDSEVEQWVIEGIADIGLTYSLTAKESETIVEDQFYIISAHNKLLRSNVDLPKLNDEPFVMSSSGCGTIIQKMFDQLRLKLNIITTVSDMSALFALVGAGYGISLVPGLAFPENWSEHVLRKSITPILNCSLKMVISKHKSVCSSVQELEKHIRHVVHLKRL